MKVNYIENCDCLDGMRLIEDNTINCVITSPPYNVNIDYSVYKDNLPIQDYYDFMKATFKEVYRLLKSDGRLAINIPLEVNLKDNGGRILMVAEFYKILTEIGYKFNGIVDLQEASPQRSRLTAWGSWLSVSSPYIYNPKECILLFCKDTWKRKDLPKHNVDKSDFIRLTNGMWNYRSETKKITKCNFSLDIPINCLKILTVENDVILDPFSGGGTTALACKMLKRNYIGFEINKIFCDVSIDRINQFKQEVK
jgi:site-specific DNA-methyltransferase (adenine-specific)